MEFGKTLDIAASGLIAQSARIRVVAENLANADSLANTPGGAPYRRRLVTFQNELDRELGAHRVQVKDIKLDATPFGQRYEPGHPAANAEGFVLTPNVKSLIEMMDLREAQRGYEANLRVIEVARTMLARTIELIG